jgi:hypothetical protein
VSEPVAELRLAHSEHHPAHPDPAAHVFVDGINGSFDHCLFHSTSEILMVGGAPRISPPLAGIQLQVLNEDVLVVAQ